MEACLSRVPEHKKSEYEKAYKKFSSMVLNIEKNFESNKLPDSEEVVKILAKSGYRPIKVPARIYDLVDNMDDAQSLGS